MKVEAEDLSAGKFLVTNRHDFIGLEHLRLSWAVTADGKVIASGHAATPKVGPRKSKSVAIPIPSPLSIKGEGAGVRGSDVPGVVAALCATGPGMPGSASVFERPALADKPPVALTQLTVRDY